jgi:hypothetical protein
MKALYRLLTASNQDFAPSCRLITAVTTRAASAAADLLCSGDYAIAFAESSILYHGIRMSQQAEPLTAEFTSVLEEYLRTQNESYAMELSGKVEFRFMFRFITSRASFDELRAKEGQQHMSDLDCFLQYISGKLSDDATEVIKKAHKRHERYEDLFESVLTRTNKLAPNKSATQVDAVRIKAIIDFELRTNRRNDRWSFKKGGLKRLTEDFFLLHEYLENFQSERLGDWCTRWYKFLLSKTEQEEVSGLAEELRRAAIIEKARPILLPIWSYFVALCHVLQEGENELTAEDAFWMGLIDEVMGDVTLPAYRFIAEWEPEAKNEATEADADRAEPAR